MNRGCKEIFCRASVLEKFFHFSRPDIERIEDSQLLPKVPRVISCVEIFEKNSELDKSSRLWGRFSSPSRLALYTWIVGSKTTEVQ